MRTSYLTLFLAGGLLAASGAAAQSPVLRLGVVAPTDGTLASYGEQAEIAVTAFAADRPALEIQVVPAPEPCDGDSDGADLASALTEAAVDVVIGMFCAETVTGAMPLLASSDIPAITVSLRSEIVMEDARTRNWPLFRLAPPEDAEASAISAFIAEEWSGEPFALIDDGTIYGRDLVEEIRLDLETLGIEPTFTDTFRPAEEKQFGLVRRLAGAGITHVFVGGDRTDIAIMARDAAAAELGLTFMGGDAMFSAGFDVALRDGIRAVVAERPGALNPDGSPAEEAIAAELERRQLEDMRPEDGYMLSLFAAAEIAAEAHLQAIEDDTATAQDALVDQIRTGTFETAIGRVSFGQDQSFAGMDYRLMITRNGILVPDGEGRRDAALQ